MNLILIILIIFSTLLPINGYAFNCSVTTTPVSFINYDVFSLSPAYSTGTVSVRCNNPDKKPIPVTIAIDSGSSGAFNPRQMKQTTGTDRLNYYLYTNASRTVIWGDGTGGTSTVINNVSKNSPWNAIISGTIPQRQNVSAGNYSDIVVVDISF
jgi:spore coat protein U-like protein